MTRFRWFLDGAIKTGRFLLTCVLMLVGGVLLLLPRLKRVAAAVLFLLTCFFVLVFLVGEISVPGPDPAYRGFSVIVLFGLEFFLKSTWTVPQRFDVVLKAGKWWVMFAVGAIFTAIGFTGAILSLVAPGLFFGLAVFAVLVFFLILLQGIRMVRWTWKHPAEAG